MSKSIKLKQIKIITQPKKLFLKWNKNSLQIFKRKQHITFQLPYYSPSVNKNVYEKIIRGKFITVYVRVAVCGVLTVSCDRQWLDVSKIFSWCCK